MLYVLCSRIFHLLSNDVVIGLNAIDCLIINIDIGRVKLPSQPTILIPTTYTR